MPKQAIWNTAERAVMFGMYEKLGAEGVAPLLPGRTHDAIHRFADRNCLVRPRKTAEGVAPAKPYTPPVRRSGIVVFNDASLPEGRALVRRDGARAGDGPR